MAENNKDALKTPQLLNILEGMDESPWRRFHRDGSRIDSRELARLLQPYGIKPANVWWTKNSNSKGYYLKDFEDAWTRYVENPDTEEQSSATTNSHQLENESFLKTTGKCSSS